MAKRPSNKGWGLRSVPWRRKPETLVDRRLSGLDQRMEDLKRKQALLEQQLQERRELARRAEQEERRLAQEKTRAAKKKKRSRPSHPPPGKETAPKPAPSGREAEREKGRGPVEFLYGSDVTAEMDTPSLVAERQAKLEADQEGDSRAGTPLVRAGQLDASLQYREPPPLLTREIRRAKSKAILLWVVAIVLIIAVAYGWLGGSLGPILP